MNQQNLFTVETLKCPVTYGPPEGITDVKTRAEHLIIALHSMSQRNMRDGLGVAVYTMPESERIWKDYQEQTHGVLTGARANRARYNELVRVNFWQATGFSALRGSGLMRENAINPRAQKMWRDFNDDYGNPKKRKQRNQYIKKLEKQVERLS